MLNWRYQHDIYVSGSVKLENCEYAKLEVAIPVLIIRFREDWRKKYQSVSDIDLELRPKNMLELTRIMK